MMLYMNSRSLTPDEQFRVIARIWDSGEDGYVFLPWIDGTATDKRDRKSKWHESPAFEWPVDQEKVLRHIEQHQDDDLFFTISKFLQPTRVKEHIGEISCLYADLDEVDPIRDLDSNMQPSVAWETSPGRYQGVWIMEGMRWDETDAGKLNHRLTASIGADESGWDTTQVLRVPGKANHKVHYRDDQGRPVQGKFMWFRSKIFKWSFFENVLPDVRVAKLAGAFDESEFQAIDRHEVWGRVRLKCSSTVREYMAMKRRDAESHDDRSAVLWQIERDLADAGCTIAEIIAVVRPTGWNKHSTRANELQQLINEASKAIGVKEEDEEDDPIEVQLSHHTPDGPKWMFDLAAEKRTRPKWLIQNIWAKGTCGFICGEPKSYKSYFALDMALSLATGTPFLNDPQFATVESRVLYLQEEDILPLVLHRAEQIIDEKAPERSWQGQVQFDRSRGMDASGTKLGLSLVMPERDIPLAMHVRTGFVASDPRWQSWLMEFLTENDFDLVIIDTLGTTSGEVNINDSVPMNLKILNPLKSISHITGVGIAYVHHNRKPGNDSKSRAGQTMLGSTALHAWVESALYVRKAETITGQPSLVYVERENKQAEDLKFRVKIPPMWQERGAQEESTRQLWQPEVFIGWGDTEDAKPDRETSTRAGQKITYCLKEMGAGSKPVSVDQLIKVYGQSKGQCIRQLNDAEANGLIVGSHENGWSLA